jgi:signal transduction histidine kinase
VDREWTAYRALPVFPGEQEVVDATERDIREMDEAIDVALRKQALGNGNQHDAVAANFLARLAIARADEGAKLATDLNIRVAARAAETIAVYHRNAHTWGLVLDAVSTLLAIGLGVVVLRVARDSWRRVQERVEDLEHFAGRVAHDIRSPLGTVSLALDIARRRPETDATTQSMLDRGVRTLLRVGQLVDGLLTFALAGRLPAEVRRAQVAEVIHGVVDDMRSIADEKGIALEHVLSEDVVVACAPGVLVSMTANLLSNAVKYMGDAPVKRIAIGVRDAGRFVRIEVRDTGPGIAPELRARIFDPYVRGADVGSAGFGLGLATVRRLAEAHGGRVGVEANESGGSLFWFELPRWEEATAARRAGRWQLRRRSAAKVG